MEDTRAEVVREYGPFDNVRKVHGVTFDGRLVWFASGDRLNALDPESGAILRTIDVAAHAGTTFDGTHFYQIAEARIMKIDPQSGAILSSIDAPAGGGDSGLAWAEGSLWVGDYRGKRIHQVDPETGSVLRTIPSNRFVTGVSWVDGELWHATLDSEGSNLRRVDPQTGEVQERLTMAEGMSISGMESDGKDRFYCGGEGSGKIRAVRRPKRKTV